MTKIRLLNFKFNFATLKYVHHIHDRDQLAILKVRPIPGHIWGTDSKNGIGFVLSHFV